VLIPDVMNRIARRAHITPNSVGGFAASIGEKGVRGRTAMKFSP
jgi:hypothetical protein